MRQDGEVLLKVGLEELVVERVEAPLVLRVAQILTGLCLSRVRLVAIANEASRGLADEVDVELRPAWRVLYHGSDMALRAFDLQRRLEAA